MWVLILCHRDDCTEVFNAGIPELLSVEHFENVNDLVAKVGPFKSLIVCFVLEKNISGKLCYVLLNIN